MNNKYINQKGAHLRIMKKLKSHSQYMYPIVIFCSITIGLFSCMPSATNVKEADNMDSVNTAHLLTRKIFFLLYEIENTPSLRNAISQNSDLKQFLDTKKEAVIKAVKECPHMDCLVHALVISDEENQQIISDLSKIYNTNSSLKDFMRDKIRPAHAYAFYANYSDSALLIQAWKEQWKGLNYIFHAYLQNKGLIYPSIDSAQFYVYSPEYLDTVKQIIESSIPQSNSELFFSPLLDIGMKILLLNNRDEAMRFIPLSKVNHEAYAQIPTIDWKDYHYSSILVFGKGPKHPDVAISPGSKKRCRMGAALYRARKAPFIVVSGGYVHPYQTKFCEAIEMKRFMVDSLNVPENVIIVEPHARHTTTNIRNTSRILLSQKVPRMLPVLGVTSKAHIDYIVSDRFIRTFKRDIGFISFTGLDRLSDTTVKFYPAMSSFQINSIAPLDP